MTMARNARGQTVPDGSITYSELLAGIDYILDQAKNAKYGMLTNDNYFTFKNDLRHYVIASMGRSVKHVGIILDRYLKLELMKYTDNFVKIPRSKHNYLELQKLKNLL